VKAFVFPELHEDAEIGVSGSRYAIRTDQREALRFAIGSLHSLGAMRLHHGKCTGADAESHLACHRLVASGMRVTIHPPINQRFVAKDLPIDKTWVCERPARTYAERNRDIAFASSVLIAVPRYDEDDPRSEHSGTWMTVGFARKFGVLVYSCNRDGSITDITRRQ